MLSLPDELCGLVVGGAADVATLGTNVGHAVVGHIVGMTVVGMRVGTCVGCYNNSMQ